MGSMGKMLLCAGGILFAAIPRVATGGKSLPIMSVLIATLKVDK